MDELYHTGPARLQRKAAGIIEHNACDASGRLARYDGDDATTGGTGQPTNDLISYGKQAALAALTSVVQPRSRLCCW